MFSKTAIFIILLLIAVGLGFLAVNNDATFRTTLWSQLFWITVGTISTTFLLNAILERDLAARRRKEDQFAFRVFTATALSSLLKMAQADGTLSNELLAGALADNQKFAEAAQKASAAIAKTAAVEPAEYAAHYLDVMSHLRETANRFIRLYSNSQQEMLEHYQNLQALARRWVYRDVFTEESISRANSLPAADPDRQKHEVELIAEISEVSGLVKETAAYLSRLAGQVASGSGVPAPS